MLLLSLHLKATKHFHSSVLWGCWCSFNRTIFKLPASQWLFTKSIFSPYKFFNFFSAHDLRHLRQYVKVTSNLRLIIQKEAKKENYSHLQHGFWFILLLVIVEIPSSPRSVFKIKKSVSQDVTQSQNVLKTLPLFGSFRGAEGCTSNIHPTVRSFLERHIVHFS